MANERPATLLQIHLPDGWPDGDAGAAQLRFAVLRGVARETGAARLDELPHASTVVAVAPASAVTYVRVNLPAVRGTRLAQALPMAVEDAIASPPDEIHAVLAEHVPGGESLVAVVARGWLEAAVAALGRHELAPARMYVETELAIHRAAAERMDPWLVVCTAAGGFVVSRHGHLGTLDLGSAGGVPLALKRLRRERAEQGDTPAEVVVFCADGAIAPDLAAWGRALGLPVRSGGAWHPEEIDASRTAATDLLRGGAGQEGRPVALPRALKAAGVAAAVVLALHGALTIVDWWRVSSESRALQARMESEFRQLFPETTAVVDASLQLERRLAAMRRESGAGDRSDLLPLLAAVSGPLAALGAQAERLRYERGELEIEIALPSGDGQPRAEPRALAVPGYRVRVERQSREAGRDLLVLRVSAAG